MMATDAIFDRSKVLSRTLLVLAVMSACVDPLVYDVDELTSQGITVDGFISDQPGPYRVSLSSTFDIDSKENMRYPVTAKSLMILDNEGNTDELKESGEGIYQTTSIIGKVGNVYRLRVELLNGSVFESTPDTLTGSGTIERLRTEFNDNGNDFYPVTAYGFDILVDAKPGENGPGRFIWDARATFKLNTRPDIVKLGKGKCYHQNNGVCSYRPPCSGFYNIGSSSLPNYVQQSPCTCCTCWYDFYNVRVNISENIFSDRPTNLHGVRAFRLPLNPFFFQNKVRIEVRMRSLTVRTHNYFKTIKQQGEGVGSLFQPATGKIPSHFVHLSGEAVSVNGIFFAASVRTSEISMHHSDLPLEDLVPDPEEAALWLPCQEVYPNSTNVKPAFWID